MHNTRIQLYDKEMAPRRFGLREACVRLHYDQSDHPVFPPELLYYFRPLGWLFALDNGRHRRWLTLLVVRCDGRSPTLSLLSLVSRFPGVCRGVDLVTVLATPLTYEGLIDELIGIENG